MCTGFQPETANTTKGLRILNKFYFADMKMTGFMLHLASVAVAVAAFLGGVDAGEMDGPCTITADMGKLQGTCPTSKQDCLASIQIKSANDPDRPGSGQVMLADGCYMAGYSSSTAESNAQYAGYSVAVDLSTRLFVKGYGGDDMVAGLTNGSGNELCSTQAKVTDGACLRSDQAAPSPSPAAEPSPGGKASATPSPGAGNGGSGAAAVGAAGVATALLAAASVVAANAQM